LCSIILSTADGDGTDNVLVNYYGVGGIPGGAADAEFLSMGYLASGTIFEIRTNAILTGTVRALRFVTGNNTTQLVLNTNNSIDMSGDLTVNDLIIGDGRFIGSASDTDAIQIEADGDVVLSQNLSLPFETLYLSRILNPPMQLG